MFIILLISAVHENEEKREKRGDRETLDEVMGQSIHVIYKFPFLKTTGRVYTK